MIQQKKQYQSSPEAAKACAEYLSQSAINENMLFFYSGGSALQVLTSLKNIHNVVYCAVDERYDPIHSNFLTLQREYPDFYTQAVEQGCKFIDTSPHKNDQYQMAEWLEQQVTLQLTTNNLQLITLLGVGEDGHIAGILPFPDEPKTFNELFVTTNRLVVGYDATGKNQYPQRFSLTYKGLELSEQIVLFATGDKKKTVLEDVEQIDYSLSEKPVKYLFTTKVPVSMFTSV